LASSISRRPQIDARRREHHDLALAFGAERERDVTLGGTKREDARIGGLGAAPPACLAACAFERQGEGGAGRQFDAVLAAIGGEGLGQRIVDRAILGVERVARPVGTEARKHACATGALDRVERRPLLRREPPEPSSDGSRAAPTDEVVERRARSWRRGDAGRLRKRVERIVVGECERHRASR